MEDDRDSAFERAVDEMPNRNEAMLMTMRSDSNNPFNSSVNLGQNNFMGMTCTANQYMYQNDLIERL
jgi:hypothetical protein